MLNKARIAVFVSGGGTNLEALLKAQEAGAIPHGEIVVVCSSSETAYALTRAANHGLPAVAVSKKGRSQAEFEEALTACLEDHQVDVIVLAGFLSILSEAFVRRWPGRIVNIHPSLIPAFCGQGYYGLMVNEIPDGGPILLQKAVEVLPGDTPEVLQRRVMEQAEWVLLPQAVELLCKQILES